MPFFYTKLGTLRGRVKEIYSQVVSTQVYQVGFCASVLSKG